MTSLSEALYNANLFRRLDGRDSIVIVRNAVFAATGDGLTYYSYPPIPWTMLKAASGVEDDGMVFLSAPAEALKRRAVRDSIAFRSAREGTYLKCCGVEWKIVAGENPGNLFPYLEFCFMRSKRVKFYPILQDGFANFSALIYPPKGKMVRVFKQKNLIAGGYLSVETGDQEFVRIAHTGRDYDRWAVGIAAPPVPFSEPLEIGHLEDDVFLRWGVHRAICTGVPYQY